ncbi:hypothetical protein O1611_g2295 [Lasiodiplodia mahajangana]|uniref:Uncharacterized protein n=1 Tax=Lasiodiplodia mahajangana TaxID=1108764 RepID=A0ACC2JUY8_9PEZI|nr:hypothetical protein O1611_g2295 [Lasiodiplodia mahajangana]
MAGRDASTTRQQTTLNTLRLGSKQDLSATLTLLIGCNRRTIWHFSDPTSRKSYIFPTRDQQFNLTQFTRLHDALDNIDAILSEQNIPKAIVPEVVRQHVQEILRVINVPYSGDVENPIEKLSWIPPEYHKVMSLYFYKICIRVVKMGPKDASLKIYLASLSGASGGKLSILAFFGATREPVRNPVWCGLVLRMICWLMLQDFDEQDAQLPKSEVQGSHVPVYI